MLKILIIAFMALSMRGQDGAPVAITEGPYPGTDYQKLFYYSGANLQYICTARSVQGNTSTISITAITAANPGVFTSVGHGFDTGAAPRVTVSGATGNWTAVNGSWLVTAIDADTFTLRDPTTGTQLDTTGATGGIGSPILRTTAPRTTEYRWAIRKYTYDGSSNLIGAFTAFSGTGGKMGNRCSDRAATYVEWR